MPLGRLGKALLIPAVLVLALWLGRTATLSQAALVWAAIGTLVLIRRPAWRLPALVAVALLAPFQIGTGTGSSITAAMLTVGGLTGWWLVDGFLHRDFRIRPSETNRPWLVLIAVAALSIVVGAVFWDPNVRVKGNFLLVQLAQLAVYALSACAYFLAANLPRRRAELRPMVWMVLVFGTLVAAVLAVPDLVPMADRLGFVSGPILRVWLVSLTLGIGLFHADLQRRYRLIAVAAGVAMVVLTVRAAPAWASGWLPAAVAAGAILLLRVTGRHWRRTGALVATVSALALVRLTPDLLQGDRWSFETRLVAWRGLLQLLEGRWLFGLGLASYSHYWRDKIGYFAYYDPDEEFQHFSVAPSVNMHNSYLDTLGQMGIVGVLALAWLLFSLTRFGWRQLQRERPGFGRAYAAACLAGLTGMMVAAILGDWVFPFVYNTGLRQFQDSMIGWLLLGGLVVLNATRSEVTDAGAI